MNTVKVDIRFDLGHYVFILQQSTSKHCREHVN